MVFLDLFQFVVDSVISYSVNNNEDINANDEISDDVHLFKPRFSGIDWYCDKCNSKLNCQKGFDDHQRWWKCTKCGYKNEISENSIVRN